MKRAELQALMLHGATVTGGVGHTITESGRGPRGGRVERGARLRAALADLVATGRVQIIGESVLQCGDLVVTVTNFRVAEGLS